MNGLQIIFDALSLASVYVPLALGLSLVFSVMGLINFSYGSLIVWAGYAVVVLSGMGLPYPLVLLLAAAFATLLSIVIGRFAFLPFLGSSPATMLLASFGVALAMQSIGVILFGDAPRVVQTPPAMMQSYQFIGLRVSLGQIVGILLSGTMLLILNYVVNRTRFGAEMRAAAEDKDTAALMGVRTSAVMALVFGLTGLIAAVVAFIWFSQVGTVTPRGDFAPTLKAFIAVVLGGLGTIRGAVLGGLALGLIESVLIATLGSELLAYQQAFAFALIILVLLLRPQGIAGRVMEISK